MTKELFISDCGDLSHQLILSIDDKVTLYMHLNKRPFYKRIWIALLYLFGKQSKYGAYEHIILNKDDCVRLANKLFDVT